MSQRLTQEKAYDVRIWYTSSRICGLRKGGPHTAPALTSHHPATWLLPLTVHIPYPLRQNVASSLNTRMRWGYPSISSQNSILLHDVCRCPWTELSHGCKCSRCVPMPAYDTHAGLLFKSNQRVPRVSCTLPQNVLSACSLAVQNWTSLLETSARICKLLPFQGKNHQTRFSKITTLLSTTVLSTQSTEKNTLCSTTIRIIRGISLYYTQPGNETRSEFGLIWVLSKANGYD